MKKVFEVKNKTLGGEQIIHFIVKDITIDELLTCTNEGHIRSLCQSGCVNYGKKWSCPPYSPKISSILSKGRYKQAVLVCGYIELANMYYIKNSYQRVKAANAILKRHCKTKAREIEVFTNGYSLLSGSCNLCKPCYKKRGLPCQKPEDMRYSLESTGINVELLAQKYCNHQLLWHKKQREQKHTSVVVAILTDTLYSDDYDFIFNI